MTLNKQTELSQEQTKLLQELSQKYKVNHDMLKKELTAIHTYYKRLGENKYQTTQDRVRLLDQAATTAEKLQGILRQLDSSAFDVGSDNLLHDLDAAVWFFLPMIEPAKSRIRRKSNAGKADDVLVNRLARLHENIVGKSNVHYSRKTCGYEGTFVVFLQHVLPFFGIDRNGADAYAQRYLKNR